MVYNKYRITMKHDITKLHPMHQKAYQDFISEPILKGAPVPDELYNVWLKLSKIPQKDWGKQSTVEAIQVVDENIK